MQLHNQNWIRDLAGAWFFYTVLPKWPCITPKFNRIARFAPWIGLIIGSIQSISWLGLAKLGWGSNEISVLVLALGILITGGLHIDGLMDTADGIAAGRERCLEAMDDSRVGSIGVQSLLIIILMQVASLIKLGSLAPIAIPIASFWGRCSPILAINNFPYLRDSGSSVFHSKFSQGLKEWVPSLIILMALLLISLLAPLRLMSQPILILGILIGIIPTVIVPLVLGIHLKGHSGDSYGASVVLVETITLLLLALIF